MYHRGPSSCLPLRYRVPTPQESYSGVQLTALLFSRLGCIHCGNIMSVVYLTVLCTSILVPFVTKLKNIYWSRSCSLQAAALGPLPGFHAVQRGGVRKVGVCVGPQGRRCLFRPEASPSRFSEKTTAAQIGRIYGHLSNHPRVAFSHRRQAAAAADAPLLGGSSSSRRFRAHSQQQQQRRRTPRIGSNGERGASSFAEAADKTGVERSASQAGFGRTRRRCSFGGCRTWDGHGERLCIGARKYCTPLELLICGLAAAYYANLSIVSLTASRVGGRDAHEGSAEGHGVPHLSLSMLLRP